jgi:hypothetical protein
MFRQMGVSRSHPQGGFGILKGSERESLARAMELLRIIV